MSISPWRTLPNPFYTNSETFITGDISGRRTDIIELITSQQSAIILSGAPKIGKSSLVHYLQQPPDWEQNWRKELAPDLGNLYPLDDIHFVQIDLTRLEDTDEPTEQLEIFIQECFTALRKVGKKVSDIPIEEENERGLRRLLRQLKENTPQSRYFVILDEIDRLGRTTADIQKNTQDQGLAVLDTCKAIRALVDMILRFPHFGVILCLESHPRPNVQAQFSHISKNLSYDLTRFKTIILQAFTWDDAKAFLAQEPANFGLEWAEQFTTLAGPEIFSTDEQAWLLEQAGTSPYLLQQFCYYAFQSKCSSGAWKELEESDKRYIIEKISDELSTFFTNTWKRLQEALERSSPRTKDNFVTFANSLKEISSNQSLIKPELWDQLGSELHYILKSEGIVRSDLRQPIHYPGASLRQDLIQNLSENKNWFTLPDIAPAGRGFWVVISRPLEPSMRIPLSELEYLLLKTLKQHPVRCKEELLMKNAWGEQIPRPTFTQRMYHLRKRLRKECGDIEIIENHYGGSYSLNNAEWFQLEP